MQEGVSDAVSISIFHFQWLLNPMPLVRVRLMSISSLQCLFLDGSKATGDVKRSWCDVCTQCLAGIDVNFSKFFVSFDVCLQCTLGIYAQGRKGRRNKKMKQYLM